MDFKKMMQQAKKMQMEIEQKEKEFENKIFEFEKQGIQLKINGKLQIVELDVNDALVDPEDKETMQDLIIITVNEAIQEVYEMKEQIKKEATQGLM